MKNLLKLTSLLMCIVLHCGLQGCKMKQKDLPSETKSKEELYYGLTADEILAMSDDDSESFREEKNIDIVKWEVLRLNLQTDLNNSQAEVKESEAKKILDRVDKKLGVK